MVWFLSEEPVEFGCRSGLGRRRFPCAEVVGDDEVLAAAGADVFGAAVEEPGRQAGVDAQAVRPPALKAGCELLGGFEGLGVGAGVECGDVTDEGAQDRLSASGAELGAGPVGERRG
jgi:hypothetical protein